MQYGPVIFANSDRLTCSVVKTLEYCAMSQLNSAYGRKLILLKYDDNSKDSIYFQKFDT